MIPGPDIWFGFLQTGLTLLPSPPGSVEVWPSPNEERRSVAFPCNERPWKWWSIPYSFKARKQDIKSLVLMQPIWQATWRCRVFLLYNFFSVFFFFIILKRLLKSCMSEQRENTYKRKLENGVPIQKFEPVVIKHYKAFLLSVIHRVWHFMSIHTVSIRKEDTGTFSYFVLIQLFSHREMQGETKARVP